MTERAAIISRRVFIAATGVASAPVISRADDKKATPVSDGLRRGVYGGVTKSQVVTLAAKPEAVEIDTAKAAVIVIDMQNDFGSKGGMFDRAGIDISVIQRAIDPTSKVIAAARQADIKIVFLKMGFRPDLSDLGAPDSVNRVRHLRMHVGKTIRAPNNTESRILIRDTWSTDIVPELRAASRRYRHV
jgi:hypothetical protein